MKITKILTIVSAVLYLWVTTMIISASVTTSISNSSGNTIFTSGTPVVIDPNLTVSSSSTIDGVSISIQNYKSGDILSAVGCSNAFNTTTGILSCTFSTAKTAAETQDFLRTVTFSTTSTDLSRRIVDFNLGNMYAFNLPNNGGTRYYKYVAANINWTNANIAAKSDANLLFGMRGYLATITSAEENAVIYAKTLANAWIGASDDYVEINAALGITKYVDQNASEGNWHWVTGPQSERYQFSTGSMAFVSEGITRYANWNGSQPDNFNENVPNVGLQREHFVELQVTGNGKWNDIPRDLLRSGYLVEYGGMPDDPVLQLSSSKTISLINEYTVTFKDADGNTHESQIVAQGSAATAPSTKPTKVGHNFTGWSTAFNNITSALDITPAFEEIPVTINASSGYTVSTNARTLVPFSTTELQSFVAIELDFVALTPSTVNASDKTAFDAKADELLSGDPNSFYFDLDLSKFVNTVESILTSLPTPVTIEFTVPLEFQNRLFKLIRVHNGVAEEINYIYSSSNHTITFQTDKFSTYGLSYTNVTSSSTTTTTNTNTPVLTTTVPLPNTGLNSKIGYGLSFIGFGLLILVKLKKQYN